MSTKQYQHMHSISTALKKHCIYFLNSICSVNSVWHFESITNFFFFSIHKYTHVQFEQLHKYIQERNKIYKKWYTQKQFLDIKLFGISRKQKNK